MACRFSAIVTLTLVLSLGILPSSALGEQILLATTQVSPARSQDAESLLETGEKQLDSYFLDEAQETANKALAIYRDRKDRLGEGKALVLLGRITFRLDVKNDRAIAYAKQGLEIAQAVRDRSLEGKSLRLLGQALHDDEEYTKALEYSQKALDIARDIKDGKLEADALLDFGNNRYAKQDYEKATDYYQQALQVAIQSKASRQETVALVNIGGIYKLSKEFEPALNYYKQALERAKASGDRVWEARILAYGFGATYSDLNDQRKDLEYRQQALQVARESKNRRYEADLLISTANIYYDDRKDYQKALELYQQAIAVAKEVKYGSAQAYALRNIGNIYNFQWKQYDKALEVYQQGLAIAKEASDLTWESNLLTKIAQTYNSLGNRPQAVSFYQQSKRVDYSRDKRNCTSNEVAALAAAYGYLEENQKSLDTLQTAVKLEQNAKDKTCELKVLTSLADTYYNLDLSKQAVATYQQSISVARVVKDRKQEASNFLQIGNIYNSNLKDYEQAQTYYQQGLAIAQELRDRDLSWRFLNNIGVINQELKRYELALDNLQQSLTIARELRNFSREFAILITMSEIYTETNVAQKSDEYFDRAIAIAKKLRDPDLLTTRANERILNAEPQKAVRLLESAIAIAREIGDKKKEGLALLTLTNSYFGRGEYQKVFETAKQGLALAKQTNNRGLEGMATFLMGASYSQLGESKQAIEYLNSALAIERELKNRSLEGQILAMLSIAYTGSQQPQKGLELAQQSLAIAQETKMRFFEVSSLTALSLAHYRLDELRQAYEFANQAFNIAQEVKNPLLQSQALAIQQDVFSSLGDKRRALDYAMQLLKISQTLGPDLEAVNLSSIAELYKSLGEPAKALEFSEKAVMVAQTSQTPETKSSTRQTLAYIYGSQDKFEPAISLAKEALAINVKLEKNESRQESKRSILTVLGSIYRKSGKTQEAIAYFEQALAIPLPTEKKPDIGDGARLGLARTYLALKQPEKAIPYYREVIANIEKVRKNIQQLSPDLQKSYLQNTGGLENKKTEDIYREYADALLSLNRVSEAMQVLDLLKVREIANLLEGTRNVDENVNPSSTPDPNQLDRKYYDSLLATAIADGKEREQLRALGDQRTSEQKQRLDELSKRDKELKAYFNQFVRSPEVKKTIAELNQKASGENIKLESLGTLRAPLKNLPNTALFYPLVLDDRIELIIATADAPPIHRSAKINRQQLYEKIQNFRKYVTRPTTDDIQISASELYDLLILPIEADLQQAKVKTILYAPDGQLRYIPLAALYDGKRKQWLVERYATNIITSANLVDFKRSEYKQLNVLAGAFPTQDVNVKVGDRTIAFKGLTFATSEVNKIAALVPKTTKLIGADFQRGVTESRMNENSYQVVHLATHGKFLSNKPENSFIVFGDGQTLTIQDISTWPLNGINLFILSACETAKGSITESSEGVEILGLGFQITHQGAKAAIATLWSIDDGGTETLMERLYTYLPQGKLSTVEALQQSQIDLIRMSRSGNRNFAHPFYWAPFILIGNGF